MKNRISPLIVAIVFLTAGLPSVVGDETIRGPRDLALSYRSRIDDTDQPYRLYLPSAYDGTQRLPLFIALHGTGGDQNKYFDHAAYNNGVYKKEAEKRGIIVVCPHGRGTTEYRGIGENDVLTVIEEVCRRFLVDRDRIICSGQSMGGTGTTYLCCRYPDLFAAGVPLASTYGHLALIENLRHVPMFYVHGEKDWPVYAQDGPIPITRRMKKLGYNGRLWMVPGAGHNTMTVTTGQVLDWALKQQRVKHPQRVTFRAYLPIHGRAYWTELSAIDKIGNFAEFDAAVESDQRISVKIRNARQFILRPDPELLDLDQPIRVAVHGQPAFEGRCSAEEQLQFDFMADGWRGTAHPRKERPYTDYQSHKIGKVIKAPTTVGPVETTLGSWMADAMRDATDADIAIATRRHFRGVPLRDGQQLYLMDLLNWLRPFNRALIRFEIDGKSLLEIVEDNIREEKSYDGQFLVQVSGCRYAFDRSQPRGRRIVETDIKPDRTYRVVCYSSLLSRGDVLHLAGRYGKIPYGELEITNISAAWRYIDKCGGQIEAKLDGRVRDVTPK
ncbi:MAG: 5'-nucleotidase C-terminal domain-containing protein [Planctomycetes bacterium]|nr:5'-nucleotidase C-terminal domain-containing protein [Planctomycetota bacterium]MBL7037561.1 5'-nucleotidase C-terminal domain-containing protein [Pirellulaceae bacterium]